MNRHSAKRGIPKASSRTKKLNSPPRSRRSSNSSDMLQRGGSGASPREKKKINSPSRSRRSSSSSDAPHPPSPRVAAPHPPSPSRAAPHPPSPRRQAPRPPQQRPTRKASDSKFRKKLFPLDEERAQGAASTEPQPPVARRPGKRAPEPFVESTDRSPVRVLVISMGGPRKAAIQAMARDFKADFEFGFVDGIDGRKLRGKGSSWGDGGDAKALCDSFGFDAKKWKKSTSRLKPEDACVLGASLAHLRAMRVAVEEGYDVIVEDNVRFALDAGAQIRSVLAVKPRPDFLYFGFLSYSDALEIVCDIATARDAKQRPGLTMELPPGSRAGKIVDLLWGMYAYSASRACLDATVKAIRDDPGKLIWPRRRGPARVRALDRVLPRLVRTTPGLSAPAMVRNPAIFRMPPGEHASTIHVRFDVRYFEGTSRQLELLGRSWDDVWLSKVERERIPAVIQEHPPPSRIYPIEENRARFVNGFIKLPADKPTKPGQILKAQPAKLSPLVSPDKPEDIRSLLTVLLTTSPIPTCPSTTLLERTLASMAEHVPEVAGAKLIVVCDGHCVRKTNEYRRGRVTDEMAERYVEYKANLSALVNSKQGVWARSEILELKRRHGFGYAVREGLTRVTTPLLLVLQHDRAFMRPFDMMGVARALATDQEVAYVLLRTAASKNYVDVMGSALNRNGNSVVAGVVPRREVAGVRLLPCVQFLDSTHIAKTQWYRDFVFDPERRLVARGGFIEDKLGQTQLADFRIRGLAAVKHWKTWLLDDDESRAVAHINGRRFITEEKRKALKEAGREQKANAPSAEAQVAEPANDKPRGAPTSDPVPAASSNSGSQPRKPRKSWASWIGITIAIAMGAVAAYFFRKHLGRISRIASRKPPRKL